jgi:hypothetical protein
VAFTYVQETGAQVANSNAYVSLADADDYYEIDTGFDATWVLYTDAVKEERIAWASRVLDQKTDWEGSRVATTQSMRWPRCGVVDRDGEAIERTEIPQPVQDATLELLKYMVNNNLTTGADIERLRRVTVDVIELEYQEDTSQTSIPTIINHILDGLGRFIVGNKRFAKINRA